MTELEQWLPKLDAADTFLLHDHGLTRCMKRPFGCWRECVPQMRGQGCRVTNYGGVNKKNASRLQLGFVIWESVTLAILNAKSAQQLAAMSIQRTQESDRTSFGSTTPVSTSPTASTTRPASVTKSPSTPPALLTPTPLTPPSSDQKAKTVLQDIIQEIENRKSGRERSTNPWHRFKLSSSDYECLQKQGLTA
jgi:hypothetical protein